MRTWGMMISCVAIGALAGYAVTQSASPRPRIRISNEGPSTICTTVESNGGILEPGGEITLATGRVEWDIELSAVPNAVAMTVSDPAKELRRIDPAELSDARAVIPDWEQHAIAQRRLETGCIPTGYEYLLRSGGVQGVDFDRFQERFDLGNARNNFSSVAEAITAEYPQARFVVKNPIKSPEAELRHIQNMIDKRRPILVSLRMAPNGGWHIMPVLGYDDTDLFLLYIVAPEGTKDIRAIKKWRFLRRLHLWGGRAVAYLDQ